MAIFILVSGAWHAGWCWERVVPIYRGRSRALAPDLIGTGSDKTPLAQVTFAKWTDQIAGREKSGAAAAGPDKCAHGDAPSQRQPFWIGSTSIHRDEWGSNSPHRVATRDAEGVTHALLSIAHD
jgi:hypothetical protein